MKEDVDVLIRKPNQRHKVYKDCREREKWKALVTPHLLCAGYDTHKMNEGVKKATTAIIKRRIKNFKPLSLF